SAQTPIAPALRVTHVGYFRIDMDVQADYTGTPNGFIIQWMPKADFDQFGWPADLSDARAMHATFTGVPTLNPDPRSASFELAPEAAIQVQVGDLFDETGVTGTYLDGLEPGDYVFRALAI